MVWSGVLEKVAREIKKLKAVKGMQVVVVAAARARACVCVRTHTGSVDHPSLPHLLDCVQAWRCRRR